VQLEAWVWRMGTGGEGADMEESSVEGDVSLSVLKQQPWGVGGGRD